MSTNHGLVNDGEQLDGNDDMDNTSPLDESQGEEPCNLLQMPGNVWETIFKHLEAAEILSLRLVCNTSQDWILRLKPSALWECVLEVQPYSNGPRTTTFDAAARSRLPIANIFINNTVSGNGGMNIYSSPGLPEFISTHGRWIQRVKVQKFGTFLCSAEFEFFESLINLKELKVVVMDARNRRGRDSSIENLFPPNFKNLKVLKFGQILSPPERFVESGYHWDLVHACPQLEYLRLPLTERELDHGLDTADDPWFFIIAIDYMNKQRANGSGELKTLDLKHFAGRHFGTATLAFLMDSIMAGNHLACERHRHPFPNLQLQNVHTEHLQYYAFGTGKRSKIMAGHVFENPHIISVIDVVPRLQSLRLPNLERMKISSTRHLLRIVCPLDLRKLPVPLPCPIPTGISNKWERPVGLTGFPDWPKLKTLSIVFDGVDGDPKEFQRIIDFVFKVKERKSVESLSIVYTPPTTVPFLAQIFTCKTLARNFGNVRVLEIIGWEVKNTGFVNLWEGLAQLAELTIGRCPNFGGSALFGMNPDEPTFLKLQNLRILRLLGVDKMPLLTDRAFVNIFSRMPLKQFYLNAEHPLEKVSEIGIVTLLDGEFGRSIEKFPFRGWSLSGYSPSEFKKLGKKFRSIL